MTTKLEKRLTMQSRPTKIASITRFSEQGTIWLIHQLSWPRDQSPLHQGMEPIVHSKTKTEGILLGTQKTLLVKSVLSRLHLNTDQDRVNKSRDIEISKDGDFLALKTNCDGQACAHHMVTGNDAPQTLVPEFLQGRSSTQNNPLPEQNTQPQNLATHFSPNSTFSMVELTPLRQN